MSHYKSALLMDQSTLVSSDQRLDSAQTGDFGEVKVFEGTAKQLPEGFVADKSCEYLFYRELFSF